MQYLTFNTGIRNVYRMETLSTKVPPSMKERIEDYAEEIGETRSTAIRELLQEGLDTEATDTTAPPWFLVQLLGWVMFSGAFFDAQPIVGYAGAALVLATILDQRFGLTDQYT